MNDTNDINYSQGRMTTNQTSSAHPSIQIAEKAMVYSQKNNSEQAHKLGQSNIAWDAAWYQTLEAGNAGHKRHRGACTGIACRFSFGGKTR